MKPDFQKMAASIGCTGEMRLGVSAEQALRAAYAAGLERAAEIADKAIIVAVEVHGNFPKGAACSELATAIRAEKEADHG